MTQLKGGNRDNAFFFAQESHLYESHYQQLRRQQVIPVLVGKVPRFPSQKMKSTTRWRRKAEKWANFMGSIYLPWNLESKTPSVFSYNQFCTWAESVSNGGF